MTKKFFIGLAVVAFAVIGLKTANAAITMTLKYGMNNTQVIELQQMLNAKGFTVSTTGPGSAGMETVYFGAKTKAAVIAFQGANGLSKDGVVGPMTLNALHGATQGGGSSNGCQSGWAFNPSTGQPCSGGTSTGGLSGTDGTVDSVTTISSYSDEEVGENMDDVKVAGFEVEASEDGDVAIKSIKLVFDPSGNAASDSAHLDDYISGVSIWMGSTKVGSADADSFSENSDDTSSKIISLSGAKVSSGDTEKFYITVDSNSNLDSGDIDSDEWSVGIENLRYIDGSGVTTTIDGGDSEVDSGADEIGWNALTHGIEIDFVDFGTAADTELKISLDSDSPDAGIIMVDDEDSTDNVVLLKGKIKLDGTSDVTIDEFPVSFTSATSDLEDMASSLILKIDGNEYTESVASSYAGYTSTTVFDDLDLDVSAGDTIEFEVMADINGTDDYTEGATITASVTASNRAMIDAENEEGDQLTASERSGTATGEAQEFRSSGIQLTFVSASTSVTTGTGSSDDQGTFTIKFKVKAIGDTVYVSSASDATTSGVTAGKTSVHLDRSGTATTGGAGTSVVLTNVTDTDLTSVGLFQLDEDEENTFELTSTVTLPTSGSAGLYRAVLGGLSWDTDSSDNTPDNAYTSNLDSFKTSYVGLN